MENILIKIANVETNHLAGYRKYNLVMSPESDDFVYSELLRIIDEKNQLGQFLPGEERITPGRNISKLKVGERFEISSGINYLITSTVEEIITPNLFRTSNSLYFLKDERFFIQQNREEKLNQIINE